MSKQQTKASSSGGNLEMGQVSALFQLLAISIGKTKECSYAVYCEKDGARNPGLRKEISDFVHDANQDDLSLVLLEVKDVTNLGTDNEQPVFTNESTHWTALNLKRINGEIEIRFANSIGSHGGKDEIPNRIKTLLSELKIDCDSAQKNFSSHQQTGADCGYYAVWHALKMLGISVEADPKSFVKKHRAEMEKGESIEQKVDDLAGKVGEMTISTPQQPPLNLASTGKKQDWLDDSSDEETSSKVREGAKRVITAAAKETDPQTAILKIVRAASMHILYSSGVNRHLYGERGLKFVHLKSNFNQELVERKLIESFEKIVKNILQERGVEDQKILDFLYKFFNGPDFSAGFGAVIRKFVQGQAKGGLYGRLSQQRRRLSSSKRAGSYDEKEASGFAQKLGELVKVFRENLDLKLKENKYRTLQVDSGIDSVLEQVLSDLRKGGVINSDNKLGVSVKELRSEIERMPKSLDVKGTVRKFILESLKTNVSRKGSEVKKTRAADYRADFLKNNPKATVVDAEINLDQTLDSVSSVGFVERPILPASFSTELISNDDSLFAHIRLFNRSQKRRIRNEHDKNLTPLLSRRKVDYREIRFSAAPEGNVKENHGLEYNVQKNKYGRRDVIDTLSSYSNIAELINNVKIGLKINDSTFAKWIRSCLKGKEIEINEAVPSEHRKEIKDFVANVTYILFGTEVVRNPDSVIMHQMMLDLVENGEKSFDDLFKKGLMPMSPSSIISDARALNSKRNKDIIPELRYEYPGAAESSAVALESAEYNLVKLWLDMRLKKKSLQPSDKKIVQQFLSEFSDVAKSWYSSFEDDVVKQMRELFSDEEAVDVAQGEVKESCKSQSPHYARPTTSSKSKERSPAASVEHPAAKTVLGQQPQRK